MRNLDWHDWLDLTAVAAGLIASVMWAYVAIESHHPKPTPVTCVVQVSSLDKTPKAG